MERYRINEIFYSLQGEGVRAGTPNLFLRFSRCNLQCQLATHGFDCDTEFETGAWMTLPGIVAELRRLGPSCRWIVLTGGEPALQVDPEMIGTLHAEGYRLAIETNGTLELPAGLDWITVSPKVAEEALKQLDAHEVKYVRAAGQPLPQTRVRAENYLVSPAFAGLELPAANLDWCIRLCRENPPWRLSVQQHKGWGVP